MISRRSLLGALGTLSAPGLLGALAGSSGAATDDYRALIVIHLNGGCDGNNVLVPTDAMYGDYQSARQNLAMSKASLAALPGSVGGHSFGLHAALQPLVSLYAQQRLAFIANVGALVEPCTAAQVLDAAVDVPPFLMSHSDQTAMVQGWTAQDDLSGWAGRALESLPSRLLNRVAAVTMDTNRTLVLGKHSAVSSMSSDGARWWGIGDLANQQNVGTQTLVRMSQWQFANPYEAEYARTYGAALNDSMFFTDAVQHAITPAGDFGSTNGNNGWFINNLRAVVSVLPYFKSVGLKRQVFLLQWGSFDTHTNQRGSDANTQDAQLAVLAQALTGLDDSIKAAGLDSNVATLVLSEFGRTVRPGSGGGSEHAWGNHWFALGGPVAGGNVLGTFPSPVLGGADDGDSGHNGRFVPTTSSDQVGATLMQWMGLPAAQLNDVFPWLANFPTKTLPLLHA